MSNVETIFNLIHLCKMLTIMQRILPRFKAQNFGKTNFELRYVDGRLDDRCLFQTPVFKPKLCLTIMI